MQKIATSDAKIFKVADTMYDNVAALLRNVASQPKTVFRAVFVVACAAGALALVFGVAEGVESEVKRYQFNKSHSALVDAMKASTNDPAMQQKYTIEQRALAFKMFTCLGAGIRYRGELFCSAQIVADAAINGGEQRAEVTKKNLRALGFSVHGWL